MSVFRAAAGSLALYKIRPARVVQVSDKIDIDLGGGKSKRVRPKDIVILHPGPLERLEDLVEPAGELTEAWELLNGEETNLEELASLIYGEFTPASAWATWTRVAEGLYFEGSPEQIRARSPEQVAADQQEREAKAAAEQAWNQFIARLERGAIESEDRERLVEVEKLALGLSENSRILQLLGHQETPVNAHRMLVGVGYWPEEHNPYPHRQQVTCEDPRLGLPPLPEESREDLTGLPAFAIDDEGSEDPDDAISLEGDRLWVHVADVAALIPPDSDIDQEARSRGANLYLPERIVHMLPPQATQVLALGLQPVSPALSIGMRLDEAARISDVKVCKSLVRVTRHSYGEINQRMDSAPFAAIKALTDRFRARRLADGATSIDLPEASVRVRDGQVCIRPLARMASRDMVTEAMVMAGEAIANYALSQNIPVPFAIQPAPDKVETPEGLAAMYAYRRKMKPSRSSTQEGVHAGLGLTCYTRTTSPLRRYLDLVVHQQLRAHLDGRELLSFKQVGERIAAVEPLNGAIRRAERLSNTHWKLIHLKRNPTWQGEAVVVEMENNRATLLIPELAMETKLRVRQDLKLDSRLSVALREVDVEDQVVWFRPLG
ncbi:RNB domain-containing ribonuclease [Sedimenticola thiotaurini]|uniref:Exoribonuclease II n=1 Tax=Sedimenticola thiotaurini TaxID=1543721 RepID=A0A0F7JS75_9GAMM|nr:RNB domain-containing ribonuclease [Sedimenticola thiotaurini]AKH19321.1 exoribonuclease II [Sedimenticola thiotaurini]